MLQNSTIYDTAARIVNKSLAKPQTRSIRIPLRLPSKPSSRRRRSSPETAFSVRTVSQGNVSGRDTHCHSVQLFPWGRDNLLRPCSGQAGNQVGQWNVPHANPLPPLLGSINDQLVRGCCRTRNSSKGKPQKSVSHSACSTKSVVVDCFEPLTGMNGGRQGLRQCQTHHGSP
jgi:hypothetical protein